MSKKIDGLRRQLRDVQEQREVIIKASTARKLERLEQTERELREALASCERLESSARHAIPESEEEKSLWRQIRELMEREAGILRERTLPEKYVRHDAVEFFKGDLEKRIREHEENSRGLKFNQSHGPRILVERQRLEAERQAFHTKIRPLCEAGQRVAEIRAKKAELEAKRNELKAARESKALATV